MEALQEMAQFLDLNARIDLKDVALQYVRGTVKVVIGLKKITLLINAYLRL